VTGITGGCDLTGTHIRPYETLEYCAVVSKIAVLEDGVSAQQKGHPLMRMAFF
jgi:hypothetical protein